MHFNDIVANVMDIIQDVLGHPSISYFGLWNNQPVLRVDSVDSYLQLAVELLLRVQHDFLHLDGGAQEVEQSSVNVDAMSEILTREA